MSLLLCTAQGFPQLCQPEHDALMMNISHAGCSCCTVHMQSFEMHGLQQHPA
jgi:hypothetical protein